MTVPELGSNSGSVSRRRPDPIHRQDSTVGSSQWAVSRKPVMLLSRSLNGRSDLRFPPVHSEPKYPVSHIKFRRRSKHIEQDRPYGSTSDFTGLIKNKNLINCFEVCMVIELPDDLLVLSHFEKLRLFPNVTVSEIVAKYRIAVWQALTAAISLRGLPGRSVSFNSQTTFS